ncbi:MAG: CBS domain-containing protein [Magnetococcales bacterium]|nr:CBS domain-containing protein [Magnetococcales bacterium]
MEIPDKIVKKTRPFFLNFFGRLGTDLNTLTASPVTATLTGVELLRGEDDIESLFEKDRCVAYVTEDGLNSGDCHIVIDVATSIALTGLMMMMGEGVITNQVKTREYNEEIQEGFNEVSNQIVGALNDLIEAKMKDGGHLFLETTDRFEYGNNPPTFKEHYSYLTAICDIQVGNFPTEECRILLSKGLADALLGIDIPGTDEEIAEIAANAARIAAGGADTEGEESSEAVADDFKEALGVEDSAAGSDGADGAGATGATDASGDVDGDSSGAGGGGSNDGSELEPGGILDNVEDTGTFSTNDGLPVPDEAGSIRVVMTEQPFALKDEDTIMTAINAMRHDGYRYIGVEKKGQLIRVVSQSDLRQVMGPFFGTKAMGPRDKAICTLAVGKLNEGQQLIRIPLTGTISQAADLMTEFNLRFLPVVSDKGVLRGFIPIHSVLNYYRKKRRS